ncbi:MAG TPA: energy transducer TonB [Vicinamibacterales bacterium]|nr:energy transducer TonB [Vicinamibacterales bacterium]
MDVTDILRDRMHEPTGLNRMATISLAAHVVLFAIFVFAPAGWFASRSAVDPAAVMTITLGGGGDGPQSGGMTSMGGRPVQAQAQPDAPREAVRAPAAAAPEMTVPSPTAKPARPSSSAVKQAPDEARGRTPTRGAQTEAGSAVAVTGARGQGFGLSSGGGPGVGANLDVGDFCCPDYMVTMITRIKGNWRQDQNVTGLTTIKFTIAGDGKLQDIELERSSGFTVADLAAQRAVIVTGQLPPLPAAYSNPSLTVHLHFQYQR